MIDRGRAEDRQDHFDNRVYSLIALAKKRAHESACRYRMGAVIAAGSRVLAAHSNIYRNSPLVDFRHSTFHAEEAALRRVRKAEGCVIYVARVNYAGVAMMARPCQRCEARLREAGVTAACYTIDAKSIGKMHFGR
ncbi:hypothetical protein ACFV0H_40900 [Streptomyces erythrochromogenes]|uniref:hypothetical protein n=1 Tax=Streptomyces erythrochromogenes TaxID=285574 RepID=UPI0036D10189